MPETKVVILNWNGEANLGRFLPSVVENTPPEVGVIVADNGSTDGSRELIRHGFPSVGLVELDRNYGYAEGYNRALSHIEADYFILLNSDVHTPPGWCEPLIAMLDSDSKIAAAAPKLLSWTDRSKFEYAGAGGGFIDILGYPFCRGRILQTTESDEGQYDDARDVFWATGACFACRAGVFRELGGFDGAFFAHQEEIDLCWRMRSAGYRVAVEPRSVVYHLGAGTLPPSPTKNYYNFRNNLAMLYKNLPRRRLGITICVRMLLDGIAGAMFLVRGEKDNFRAVLSAHRDFRSMRRGEWGRLRAEVQKNARVGAGYIYKGSIVLRYILGCKRFGKLM